MRIRKNAKVSTSFYSNTNASNDFDQCLLQKNLCQLNQSPWDIITFTPSDSSSSFHQFDDNEVYYNVNVAGNGSSVESVEDFESVASKTSGFGENDYDNDTKNDYGEVLGFKEEVLVLCDKTDEKGWQCGRVVKNGNTMCGYHFSEVQNCTVWTTKKQAHSVSGPTAKCRARQTKKQHTTNPYDFYYYSGFGPSWGKKRGMVSNVYTVASKSNDNGYDTSGVDEYMDVKDEKGKRVELETTEAGSVVGYDCIDDNDDEEKGKSGIIGKKRGRKPIKARSLKSLM